MTRFRPIEKRPLALTVADRLRQGIVQKVWQERLPSERAMGEMFNVGRTTLRSAIQLLKEEGILESQHGQFTRIRRLPDRKSVASNHQTTVNVCLLSPLPLFSMRQNTLYWIDQLRSHLHDINRDLKIISHPRFFRPTPEKILAETVQANPHNIWLLMYSNHQIQQWFKQAGVPVLVIGAIQEGIGLPSISVDNRGTVFHAIGQLTTRGHRSIAMVAPENLTAGNEICVQEFKAICQAYPNDQLAWEVIRIDRARPRDLEATLARLESRQPPRTGIIMMEPFHLVTAYNYFHRHGLQMPADISLVSIFSDKVFEYLIPEPATYRYDLDAFARRIFKILNRLMQGMNLTENAVNIVPTFFPGGSLGRVRKP